MRQAPPRRALALGLALAALAPAVIAQNCPVPTPTTLRVSVGGFGYVTSSGGPSPGVSCGSVPAGGPTSTRCFTDTTGGSFVILTAIPYSNNFQFSGWAGDTTCTSNPCVVDVSVSRWVRAKFTPVVAGSNVCSHLGLVSDKTSHPLNGNFPVLAVGQAFTDPNFGTTIRRITNVAGDGRGANRVLKSAYSTVSAWNADESYLILYRSDGSGTSSHELFNGKTYAFIRKLTDLPTADLEQFYWDTTRPNIVYGASGRILYQYDVDAPSGQRLKALRDFTPQCGTKTLYGGGDPLFNSWDSKIFGLVCNSGGATFSYNRIANTVGTTSTAPRADVSASAQAAPSGTKMFLNQPQPGPIRIYDLNMVAGVVLDQNTGDEHSSTNMLFNGNDTYNAVQFDPGPSGTDVGMVVQWNFAGTPNAQGRIPGRIIVGPNTGYPYPPGSTHVGGTSFHRTGLLVASGVGNIPPVTALHGEVLYIDSDPATNSANSVCRVGHNRTSSSYYFAEPHPSISPSGTRIVFSSSWGDTSNTAPIVNSYVIELPGYRP